jgi:hypothetical protein
VPSILRKRRVAIGEHTCSQVIAVSQNDNAANNAKKASWVGVKVVVALQLELNLLAKLVHAQNYICDFSKKNHFISNNFILIGFKSLHFFSGVPNKLIKL